MPRKKDPNAAPKTAKKPRAAKPAVEITPNEPSAPGDVIVVHGDTAGTLADLKPEPPAVSAPFGIGARRVPRAESAEG